MVLKRQRLARFFTAAALSASFAVPVHAGDLEPAGIDLGLTSFFDGFGGTEPGFAYLGYYGYSHLDNIVDNGGHGSPAFKDPKIDVFLMLNQLVYVTPLTFFDGSAHLGFMGLLPLVGFDTGFAPSSPVTLSSVSGFGDLTFGALLQFDPVKQNGRAVFSQRVELDAIAPIGKYSSTTNINPSSHFWSIVPYYAGTWLPTPRTELSLRLNYLYNFANGAPAALPPTVTSTRAGQAAWGNFTASYEVLHRLNVGVNGYYFRQFTNDVFTYSDGSSDTGMAFGDTGKMSLFAIGPGAHWRSGKDDFLNFNVYFQVAAANTTRGSVFNLHWIHAF